MSIRGVTSGRWWEITYTASGATAGRLYDMPRSAALECNAQSSAPVPLRLKMARILCLDPGQKRIGMAISDAMASMAFPLGIISRTTPERDLAAILSLVREEGVQAIVLGLPLTLKGEQGEAAQAAQSFGEELAEKTGLPVEMWDERLSTAAAERALIEAGVRREKRKQARDAMAATIILQSYLDRKRALAAGQQTSPLVGGMP